MTPEKWQRIREILESAVERHQDERAAYLDRACQGDEVLRREVESLLSSHEEAGDFIESSPVELAAQALADKTELADGQYLKHYKILSRLGFGGMGEVYLARDTKLGRKVAIKLLPVAFTSDQDRVRRFEQEARAASSLNHPNILTIFEIAQVGQNRFIAMELIEGCTLRDALTEGPLPLTEALAAAIQTASALAAAHKSGIVHRDIKPENIMLRPDGYVKVLDFGLAKLAERSLPSPETDYPTAQLESAPGLVMGTPNYMSPEQARGLAVDAQSDIFSLGVVIYEMIAGCLPFTGETPTDALASILRDHPQALAERSPQTPAELQRIVSKSLCKEKEQRYQSVQDMLIDLRNLKEELEIQPRLIQSGSAPRAQSPVIAIRQRWRAMVAILALLIVSAVSIFYLNGRDTTISSVAVLPLANLSNDPEADYLSDGIADSVIRHLSQLSGLKVMAFSSVTRYKGLQVDSKTVGSELNVQAVLIGRLTQRGDDLSINVELVDVRDNSRIWGQQYNRKLADMLAVQEEIAKEISEKLRLQLTGEDQRRMAKNYTENSEAYRFYLKGRYNWNLRSEEGLRMGINYFKQAITLDSDYALAYAGLADCYGLLSNYSSTPPKEAMALAKEAAKKALSLDPSLAEARASLGLVKKEYDWDVAGAESEFQEALRLNPSYSTAYQWRAENLITLKRTEEAIEAMKMAQEFEPFSLIISSEIGWVFYQSRQFDMAVVQLQKTAEMSPTFSRAHFFLGRVYEQKRMYEEARVETQKAISLSGGYALFKASLGHIYGMEGKKAEAQKLLDELKEKSLREYVSPFAIALIYTGMGDKDRAFEWIEKAYVERDTILINYLRDPQLDPLRSDQRFVELLSRFRLAP